VTPFHDPVASSFPSGVNRERIRHRGHLTLQLLFARASVLVSNLGSGEKAIAAVRMRPLRSAVDQIDSDASSNWFGGRPKKMWRSGFHATEILLTHDPSPVHDQNRIRPHLSQEINKSHLPRA
jgi:hypothetical protein